MGILEKKKQAFINMLSHQDIKKTMDYKPPILLRNNTDNNEIKYKNNWIRWNAIFCDRGVFV